MTHAKKHHFVPQFILRRFADADEKLIVHRLTGNTGFTSTVRNTGHRNFGHTMTMPGREPDHTTLEAAMTDIEGEAATAVSELDSLQRRVVPPELRPPIAWFLALQWQRNRFLLHLTRTHVRTGGESHIDATLYQTVVLSRVLLDVIHPWRLRDQPDARPKERWNYLASTLLSDDMHWSCFRPRHAPLIVSDTSVCFSGAREGFEPDIPIAFLDHGVGAGFVDFRRVTVPWAPASALSFPASPRRPEEFVLETSIDSPFSIAASS
ncbi:DUF4238 domain-containing protein [Microbispora sp. ATCC PTA-5024]|uniref:DUF4238 domain-containing protein n=1 Tax=Microbispora sp. ATCC PTA-5024 TaxID=316330 RepID=UPI0009FCE46F